MCSELALTEGAEGRSSFIKAMWLGNGVVRNWTQVHPVQVLLLLDYCEVMKCRPLKLCLGGEGGVVAVFYHSQHSGYIY